MELNKFDGAQKVLHHRQWLAAYRRGELVAPICIEMDLTNVCNYGCPNCVWSHYRGQTRTSVEPKQALEQVRQCAQAGVMAIIFSGGGEPLMHPALDDCIHLAVDLGLSVGLFTNCLPVTPARARMLSKACTWIRAHLDAASPDGYVRKHKLPARNVVRVGANMRLLRDANPDLVLGLGSVINEGNLQEMDGLVDLAERVGADFFQAKHDFQLLSRDEYTTWWSAEVVPRLRAIEQGEHRLRIQYSTHVYTRPSTACTCHIHHLVTAINAESDYVFCKRLRDRPAWSLGNLREKSLLDILGSERRARLAREVTPHTCGVVCPYLEFNELLESLVMADHVPVPGPLTLDERHLPFF